MKKQLLVLIAYFLTTQLSFSQDTLANMLEVGNKWSRFYSNTKYMGYNVYGEVTKDTSIQGLQFVIVNETYVANYNNGNYPNIYNKLVLRQNKNGLYTYLNGKIEIVYQFSGLNVGDSIKTNRYIIPGFNQNSQDSITKIISIDTITVGLSKIRRFYLGSVQFAGFNYFFESIGFTCAGPLNTNPATWIDGVVNKLFCFKNKNGMFHTEGNIDIYTLFSGTSSSCSNIVSKVDDNTLLSHIFLSKTSENQIQLSSSINLSNAQLTLYDMKGSAFAANLQQDNTIDVTNLQAGLYVLRLQTADQKLANFKFVK